MIKEIRFQDRIPAYTLLEFIPASQIGTLPKELSWPYQYMVDKETMYPESLIPKDQANYW